jgi:Pentapeptide repeats (9 copies)
MSQLQATRDAPPPPDWPTCTTDGCIGVRIEGRDACLAHVGEEARKTFLAGLHLKVSVDLRGTQISATLLNEILAATSIAEGVATPADIRFDRAQFTEDASFDQTQFSGNVVFVRAQFLGGVSFKQTQFTKAALFSGAQFVGSARFDEAQFSGDAVFTQAQFSGAAEFDETQFSGAAQFSGAQFSEEVWFGGAQFSKGAEFNGAQFFNTVGFGGTWFLGSARFEEAQFSGDASFNRTQFTDAARFERARFSEAAWFNRAHFTDTARFAWAQFMGAARFDQAQFPRGARFEGAQFSGNAVFGGVQFSGAVEFGGAQFSGDVWFDQAQFSRNASFTQAKFSGDAWYTEANFTNVAQFSGAQFSEDAWFDQMQFSGNVVFARAQFSGDAAFNQTQFTDAARFDGAQFSGNASYNRAQFTKDASFTEAHFTNVASFTEAHFSGNARFDEARFSRGASFVQAQFSGDTWFGRARFSGDARLERTRFDQAQQLGPILVAGFLRLDHAVFTKRVEIAAIGRAVSCVRTQFSGGAALEVGFAAVALDDTQFLALSRLVGTASQGFSQEELGQVADPNRPGDVFHPRLLSLRGTDVTNLWLSNVDLGMCAFTGAQNLQTLRAEVAGVPTPRGWHTGWAWPPIWRWTRRNALVEEHAWRATTRKSHGWTVPAHLAGSGGLTAASDPRQLAAVYRALREGREASKDEPGAADFYYGEMEMRREAPATPWSERFIVWWYWLLAGYGLRGLRALGWLLALVAALAMMFSQVGFAGAHPSLWNSLVYTVQATLSLESKAKPLTHQLSVAGEVLRIVLRLSGPVLLGLALLSVRNRVKR